MTRLRTQKWKHLLTSHNQLEADEQDIDVQIKQLEKQKADTQKKKQQTAKKLNNKQTIISEHAICRAAERLHGIDLKALEKQILDDRIKKWIEELGPSGTYPAIDDKFRVVVKNNVIITVIV